MRGFVFGQQEHVGETIAVALSRYVNCHCNKSAVKLRHVLSMTVDHVRPRPVQGGGMHWGRVLLCSLYSLPLYHELIKTGGGLSLGKERI